jgi:hypothetical protein
MLKLTLSTYTLEPLAGEPRKVWQVMLPGSPLTRELDSEQAMRDAADAAIARHHGKVELYTWDGDACEHALVWAGMGGSGSERSVA